MGSQQPPHHGLNGRPRVAKPRSSSGAGKRKGVTESLRASRYSLQTMPAPRRRSFCTLVAPLGEAHRGKGWDDDDARAIAQPERCQP
jgi:hypothetical protein